MICWDAAARRTRTLPGTASTFPRVVVPNELFRQSQPEVLVVKGRTTLDIVRLKNKSIRDRHIKHKTKNVFIILHALPSYMVATPELVTVVDTAHEPVVQGNAHRALNFNPRTILLSSLHCGMFCGIGECAGYIDHFVVFPCSGDDDIGLTESRLSTLEPLGLLADDRREVLPIGPDSATSVSPLY